VCYHPARIHSAPLGEEHLGEARQAWGRISDQPEVTWGWRTFAQYLQVLERGGLAINLASLAGHGALRVAAMGLDEREPTSSVLARMKELLSEAMESGAFGLSTGLVYPPGCYAHTEEIVALCRVVADYGGLYASHIRGELTDRGVLRQGARADIVVVDLARIRDRATNPYPHAYPFENYPHQYSEGIDYVFVNGVLVIKGERHSGALPGKVLRRRADGGRRRAMQTVNQEAKR
jgi:N-acyl-D-aspartate/D-glutamate deacylase